MEEKMLAQESTAAYCQSSSPLNIQLFLSLHLSLVLACHSEAGFYFKSLGVKAFIHTPEKIHKFSMNFPSQVQDVEGSACRVGKKYQNLDIMARENYADIDIHTNNRSFHNFSSSLYLAMRTPSMNKTNCAGSNQRQCFQLNLRTERSELKRLYR